MEGCEIAAIVRTMDKTNQTIRSFEALQHCCKMRLKKDTKTVFIAGLSRVSGELE